MNRIFLDSNCLLDLLAKRAAYPLVARILSEGLEREQHFFASANSFAVADYLLRSYYAFPDVKGIVLRAMALVEPLDVNKTDILNAYQSPMEDNEDAIGYFCALRHNCEVIITRDRSFQHQSGLLLPVLSPEAFLDREG